MPGEHARLLIWHGVVVVCVYVCVCVYAGLRVLGVYYFLMGAPWDAAMSGIKPAIAKWRSTPARVSHVKRARAPHSTDQPGRGDLA